MARKKKSRSDSADWLPARQAAERLGFSHWTLAEYRLSGVLVEERHYRRVGNPLAARPNYRYHVRRCADLLGVELPS